MWIGPSVRCKLLFLCPVSFRAQIWFQDTKGLISAIGICFQEYLQAVIAVFTVAARPFSEELPWAQSDADCYSVCRYVFWGFFPGSVNTAGIRRNEIHMKPYWVTIMPKTFCLFLGNRPKMSQVFVFKDLVFFLLPRERGLPKSVYGVWYGIDCCNLYQTGRQGCLIFAMEGIRWDAFRDNSSFQSFLKAFKCLKQGVPCYRKPLRSLLLHILSCPGLSSCCMFMFFHFWKASNSFKSTVCAKTRSWFGWKIRQSL